MRTGLSALEASARPRLLCMQETARDLGEQEAQRRREVRTGPEAAKEAGKKAKLRNCGGDSICRVHTRGRQLRPGVQWTPLLLAGTECLSLSRVHEPRYWLQWERTRRHRRDVRRARTMSGHCLRVCTGKYRDHCLLLAPQGAAINFPDVSLMK